MKLRSLLFAALFAFPFSLIAEQAFPVSALPSDWAMGSAPEAWAKGELYVIECWATWCGPCVRAIPHMEELWQELKDERIHIIGINVMDNHDEEGVRKFLKRQKVPPTYPNAIDKKKALPAMLGFSGIPFAFAVKDGEIVWRGHPVKLNADTLLALRDGKEDSPSDGKNATRTREASEQKESASQKPGPPTPMEELKKLETQADAVAEQGDFVKAAELQRQALLKLSIQKKLTTPYTPTRRPPTSPIVPLKAETVTVQGDATPYAELLDSPIPADDVFTFISLWRCSPWQRRFTANRLATFPGRAEAVNFPHPHRVITVTAEDPEKVRALLDTANGLTADLRFPKAVVDPELFGFTSNENGPYVALFLKGELLYKGPINRIPEALTAPYSADTQPTPKVYKEGIAKEKQDSETLVGLYRRYRTTAKEAPEKAQAVLDEITAMPLTDAWAGLLVPCFFGKSYYEKNPEAAVALLDPLALRFNRQPHALQMLYKMIQAWPEFAEVTLPKQSLIAERIAEINTRDEPNYTAAWYEVAGDIAKQAEDTVRAEKMYRKAIDATAAALRWQDFANGRRALPAR